MKNTANARYRIHYHWSEEAPFSQGAGKGLFNFTKLLDEGVPRMARSRLLKTYTGDVEGDGEVVYLMMYRSDTSVSYVGLERIFGRIGDKHGSFVLQRTGAFESVEAKESYSVVPGSGTGDLRGLKGEGSAVIGHGTELPFTLTYELP